MGPSEIIANTASIAYPIQTENLNREWTRVAAKVVGWREGGVSTEEAMGFDDIDLTPWKKTRQTLMD
jgi:hypothetical protein